MHELIGVAFSHYVEKARWALDRFGVEYRDQRYLPFVHVVPVYLAHGGQAGRSDKASSRFSTPVLRTDDGRTLCDSADILHYVSARYARPEDNLYPDREAETLEQRLHDELGPHTRRAAYWLGFARPDLFRALARNNVGPLQAGLFAVAYPFAKRGLSRALAIDEERVQRSIEKTQREFDAVSSRLSDGRPFLLGDRFTAADLTFAALAAPALMPPEYSAWLPAIDELPASDRQRTLALRETPAGAFALRMFREERRRRLPTRAS